MNMVTRTSVALLLLLSAAGCAGTGMGAKAPNFNAVDSMGSEVSLAAFDDTVLILDFWAVW